MMHKVMWKHEEQFGFEYFLLIDQDESMVAEGTIIYEVEDDALAHIVNYTVTLDEHWVTQTLEIVVDNYFRMKLTTDGQGNWFNRAGINLPDLKGAMDIDIAMTPFSSSLPINRMVNWEQNEQKQFDVIYIYIPTLETKMVHQTYTYLYQEGTLRFFQFRCYSYETTISVNEEGLVVSYPNVFHQMV
jgi:uncharacterized protein